MRDRWGALFHALTDDTVDTLDKVAARTAPAAQSVKTVQSVYCQSWRKEDGVELRTRCAGQRLEPSSAVFAKALAALERRCPDYVEANRWWQGVEDGRRFLARWGDQAGALGWTAEDLFGLHTPPERPHPSYRRLRRYDATGLIWLLQGRPVVALTEATAAIQSLTGAISAITTYRRHNKPALGPVGDSLDDFQ
jgi:hypothetical protein